MFLPILMPEPLVALGRLRDRGGIGAEELEHRGLPERRILPPEVELGLGQTVRIGKHLRRQLEECLGDAELVRNERLPSAGLSGDKLAQQLGALVGGGGKTLGQRYGIV